MVFGSAQRIEPIGNESLCDPIFADSLFLLWLSVPKCIELVNLYLMLRVSFKPTLRCIGILSIFVKSLTNLLLLLTLFNAFCCTKFSPPGYKATAEERYFIFLQIVGIFFAYYCWKSADNTDPHLWAREELFFNRNWRVPDVNPDPMD